MFDIRKIAIGLTADMPVCDVDGNVVVDENGKELSITFHSPGSKEFIKARAQLRQELAEEFAREEANSKKKVKKSFTDEELDRANLRTIDYVSKLVVSLNGFDYPGGPKAMFSDPTLGHILQDADNFLADRGNFKQSSASGSLNSSGTQPG